MLRYVDGGKRFLPGDWPTEPLPFFEEEGSVTIYTERPDAVAGLPAVAGVARRRLISDCARSVP